MSRHQVREAILSLSVAFGLVAVTPLHAQGPAVELEGYYAQAAIRPNDGAAMPAPVVRTAAADRPTSDGARPAQQNDRDESNAPVVAHLETTLTLTRR